MGALPFVTPGDVTAALPLITQQLGGGKLLAYPTETVYGLGSSVDPLAVERMLALKPRSQGKPFLLLISGMAMLDSLGLRMTPNAASLASRCWPGPLTLLLAGAGKMHPALRGPTGQVGVRWTSHRAMQRVISALGAPVTSTSANLSGLPSAGSAREIVSLWEHSVASGELLVLDGGTLDSTQPSTVVDCSTTRSRIVRLGAIGLDALLDVVPDLAGDG